MTGTIVGTYRLEELLGDGGLGGVYRAVDGASGKEAAFRLFTRNVSADGMLADRLRAMAPALKRLQHPNIAAFYELMAVGPDLALFLEFVPGATLDKVRQPAGRLDTNVSVSCAVQVLRGLEAAHGAGVLHHALRPSNVMVTRQGTVKVLDFGIGHAFGANRKTREDRLLAVLAYLAPEQIQNQPGDARSDIYAVGVLLYELLTGRLPFDHPTEFALRQAHLSEPPAPPRTIVPALPEWLEQSVLRALAKNPASRYQNATEFRAVLEAALGLSTSREAAIVRQRDGAYAETFAAAPPLPPPPSPNAAADAVASTAATVAAPGAAARPGERPVSDAAETVVSGAVASAAPAGTAAGRATVTSAPVAAKAGTKHLGLIVAGVLALVAVAAAAYVLTRGPAAPAPGDEMAAAGQVPLEPPPADAAAPQTGTPEPSLPPPPTATVPAAAAPPSAPPTQAPAAAPAASKKAQPKSAAGPKAETAVPGPPTAVPPAPAAVPAAAPPAPPAAPRAERLPDTTYRKVKLVTQSGSSEKSTDVVLLFSDVRLSVTPAGGGAALRTLGYAEITATSYSKAQKKRLGFIKSAQHLLEIETGGEPLLLRLDKDNFEQILSALEVRSGKVVSR
jgi:serine/threonine-protein kinase